MRKIKFHSAFIFVLFLMIAGTMAYFSSHALYLYFQGNSLSFILLGFLFFYLYAILIYRIFLKFYILEEGDIEPDSRLESIYHVYILFYLILFYQLIRPKIIPVPILKLVYLLLGAQLGKNTFSSGTILDPVFTSVGDNTIIGEDSCLFAHAIEGKHLSHKKIIIGNNVTIGAKSIIMSGVKIGDNSIVAAGSVVRKNIVINENETWGGNPAKCLKRG